MPSIASVPWAGTLSKAVSEPRRATAAAGGEKPGQQVPHAMPHHDSLSSRIEYSEKYNDEEYEYRYVLARARRLLRKPRRRRPLNRPAAKWPADGTAAPPPTPPYAGTCAGHPSRRRSRSHVILPKELAKSLPKSRLLSDQEWRNLGVQQSRGWEHYAIHRPEPHILLFRRPLGTDPTTGRVNLEKQREAKLAYQRSLQDNLAA